MKKFVLVTSIVVLAVVMATMFMACTPSEESLTKKYEENGYAVASVSQDKVETVFGIKFEENAQIQYVLLATKLIKNVAVICFENSEDAKKFYESVKPENNDGVLKVSKKGNAIALALNDEEGLKLF